MIASSQKDEPRVLLAADDDASRSVIKQALCGEGARVKECRDGFELFTELTPLLPPQRSLDFDLIIVDPAMPGASWLEIVAALNADNAVPPVLLIEGPTGGVPKVDIAGLPVAGYIALPLNGESVLETARSALAHRVPPCPASRGRRGEPCW